MDNKDNRAPSIDGTSYSFWNIKMTTHIMYFGADVWHFVVYGYQVLEIPSQTQMRENIM